MSTKKQNFAAAAFISAAAKQQTPPETNDAAPAAEIKSRRVQLLLKPSDYEKLRRIADRRQCSVNSVIESMITDAEE